MLLNWITEGHFLYAQSLRWTPMWWWSPCWPSWVSSWSDCCWWLSLCSGENTYKWPGESRFMLITKKKIKNWDTNKHIMTIVSAGSAFVCGCCLRGLWAGCLQKSCSAAVERIFTSSPSICFHSWPDLRASTSVSFWALQHWVPEECNHLLQKGCVRNTNDN